MLRLLLLLGLLGLSSKKRVALEAASASKGVSLPELGLLLWLLGLAASEERGSLSGGGVEAGGRFGHLLCPPEEAVGGGVGVAEGGHGGDGVGSGRLLEAASGCLVEGRLLSPVLDEADAYLLLAGAGELVHAGDALDQMFLVQLGVLALHRLEALHCVLSGRLGRGRHAPARPSELVRLLVLLGATPEEGVVVLGRAGVGVGEGAE